MRALFIATRAPYGRMYGHKMGIRTYIRALQALGHEVVIAAFSVPGDKFDQEDLDAKTYYLPMPSPLMTISSMVTYGLIKKKSINECLYLSKRNFERIREICRAHEIQVVIADMVRTAPYAEATGKPWLLDHEDLLSVRYRQWATRASGSESILGYLTEYVPFYVRPGVRWLFEMALSRESELLEFSEVYWSSKALGSSLRSVEETASFAARSQRRVFCMPISVPVPNVATDGLEKRPLSAIFTGGLTYQPNLDAMRAYVRKILPAFQRQGLEPPSLTVIGACPEPLKAGLKHPSINYVGHVSNVNEELRQHQVFFAPIVSGTGIKTKMLEAMACGLPVIALPAAVTGLSGEPMRHYLVAQGPDEFVRCYLLINDHPTLAKRIALAARDLVMRSYSIEAASRILGSELDRIMPALVSRANALD